jgi:hypothetical protein
MTLVNNIPEIMVAGSLGIQRAVHEAGEEIEFITLAGVGKRRDSGFEQSSVKWKPDRRGFSGVVVMGAFYSRFNEYGSAFQAARPVLGPAADEVEPQFLEQCSLAYRAR